MSASQSLLFCLILVLLAGCAGSREAAAPVEPVLVRHLDARGEGDTYFDLHTGTAVDGGADWDLAFQGTTIRVNGTAQLVDVAFDALAEAPSGGYLPGDEAVPGGSGSGWYLYDASVHQVTPVPGRTLVLRTTGGDYAKVEILSYYLGGPEFALPTEPRRYTFRYALQPGGARALK